MADVVIRDSKTIIIYRHKIFSGYRVALKFLRVLSFTIFFSMTILRKEAAAKNNAFKHFLRKNSFQWRNYTYKHSKSNLAGVSYLVSFFEKQNDEMRNRKYRNKEKMAYRKGSS